MNKDTSDESETQERSRRLGVIETSVGSTPSCPTCEEAARTAGQSTSPAYVYALGKIEARFPRLSIEKEFAQASRQTNTSGRTDQQVLVDVLSSPDHRYLVRQLCWVLTIQGMETYLLQPRDPEDFNRLVEAIRSQPSPLDLDVVIGVRGRLSPPTLCNGLIVPIIGFSQIYSLDRASLIRAIPRAQGETDEQFEAAAEHVFDNILQMTDNAGATDEHRALNYLAMRYPGLYVKTAEQFSRDFSLGSLEVRTAPLSGQRNMVDVICSFVNRSSDFTEKFLVRVDVTDEFPFLVTKMAPYYDRHL